MPFLPSRPLQLFTFLSFLAQQALNIFCIHWLHFHFPLILPCSIIWLVSILLWWWTHYKVTPNKLCPYMTLSLGGTCDLLLTKRIWQSWWNFAPIIMLYCVWSSFGRMEIYILLLTLKKQRDILWTSCGESLVRELLWPVGPQETSNSQYF